MNLYKNWMLFDEGEGGGSDEKKEEPKEGNDNSAAAELIKKFDEQLATMSGKLKKAEDAAFGSSRRGETLEKEVSTLKTDVGKVLALLESNKPKPKSANDKLKDKLRGKSNEDDDEALSLAEYHELNQKSVNELFDSKIDALMSKIETKITSTLQPLDEKLKEREWSDKLKKLGIAEDLLDLVPYGSDETKLNRILELSKKLSGDTEDEEGKKPSEPDKKKVPIKESKEPSPQGGGESGNPQSDEMTAKMTAALKAGKFAEFEKLWADAVDKKIPLDGDMLLELYETKKTDAIAEQAKSKKTHKVLFS